MKKLVWDGLDLAKFFVVAIWPQDSEHAVILMRDREKTDFPWCVEYKGNGHYFKTVAEAFDYCEKRKFKIKMDTNG